MNKLIASLLALVLLVACAVPAAWADEKKVSVVTTIFPIYDWMREITDGTDAVELTLLLDNGVDLHSYQPTAQDILKISTADMFVYVGGMSDEWVENVLETAMNPQLAAVSLVEAMGEGIKMEEIVEGMEHEHDHDHEHEHEHDEDHEDEDHDHDHDHEHEHEHEEEADEHVWLSLRNAQTLVQALTEALAAVDPAHADAYQANAAAYIGKLAALDAEYVQTVESAAYRTLLFGDRFPFRYMADDYGLTYFAAFTGCSAESEASFATVVFLSQKVDELGLPAVLTIENAKGKIAETIVANTAAKNQKILAMDSMQSTIAQDIKDGATYLAIMENNLLVLREALN